MERRLFIKASVACASLTFPGASLLATQVAVIRPPEGLGKLFTDDEMIRQLGIEYLHACPGENDIDVLQNLAGPVEDSVLVAAAVRQDFENGDVVQLEGWILSRTEARHCALFSIL